MWSVIKHLNNLRNAMAHELEPDQQKIEKTKQIVIDLVRQPREEGESPPDLRACLGFTAGWFLAFLEVALTRYDLQKRE